ncbi:hypothetical protein V6N12_003877 [Hibiscus sabdariffa]|uniref:BURP domain-containing protein n=1 Tax=Hibiscus sabdariffa TaxID=183260 RepID=A0ABR2CJT0_9ROSI
MELSSNDPPIGDENLMGTFMAACHEDTSSWSSEHLSFHLLKVLLGTVPICHFLKKGTVVYVSSPSTS